MAVTDPTGAVTRTKFDALGRVVETIDPTGVSATATYDAVGRVLSQTKNGSTVTGTYDAAGHQLSRTTQDGAVTTYEYGPDGELTREVSPLGNVSGATPSAFATLFGYDADGNQTGTVDPLGRHTGSTFDGAGNVTSTSDPMAHTTAYTYTALGAVATVTTPTGATTTYHYDSLGRVTGVTNPNGGDSTATYDAAGRKVSQTTPGGHTTNYTYDADGNVVLTGLPNGSVAQSYNSVGQLVGVNFSDATPDLTYTYNKAGKPTQISNGAVAAQYKYDLAGRVLEISRGNSSFTYGYDDSGRLVSRQYPDGRSQTYAWDASSRLASVGLSAFGATNSLNYTYDAAGQLTQTVRSNGPTTTNAYDAAGQLATSQTANGATPVTSQSLQWNAAGLPTKVSTTQYNSTKSVLYSYDASGHVATVCSPTSGATCQSSSPKVTFTYDGNGNRTVQSDGTTTTAYSYDSDDRLLTTTSGAAVTSYTYGANGDLKSQANAAGTVQYAYGLDGNLYNATLTDGTAVAMAYDESGNRIQRNVNGAVSAKWVWDTNAALAVRTNETGASTYRWFEDPQANLGTAVAQVSSVGEPTWLIPDFTGTIIATARTAGATAVGKFDAFGNLSSGSMAQPLQFQGQYKDSVLGLYDMRARDYNSVTGQFTASDPLAVPTGHAYYAGYSYAYNNPLLFSDPTGMWGWSNITKFVSDHKAAIVSTVAGVVAGVLVTAGCLALTEGTMAPLCIRAGAIVGGAVSGAVSYHMSTPAKSRTLLGYATATARGGVFGGLTSFAGEALAPVFSRIGSTLISRTPSAIATTVDTTEIACASGTSGISGTSGAANTVATKVAEMQAGMTEGELGRTTYAAAHVTTAEGSTETWVASAGKSGYVRPAVRGDALNMRAPASADLAGLEHINDAEMHLFRAAEQQGATINAIGATRPVCPWCQARLPSDVPIVTELK